MDTLSTSGRLKAGTGGCEGCVSRVPPAPSVKLECSAVSGPVFARPSGLKAILTHAVTMHAESRGPSPGARPGSRTPSPDPSAALGDEDRGAGGQVDDAGGTDARLHEEVREAGVVPQAGALEELVELDPPHHRAVDRA
jgi:hypothetical protein